MHPFLSGILVHTHTSFQGIEHIVMSRHIKVMKNFSIFNQGTSIILCFIRQHEIKNGLESTLLFYLNLTLEAKFAFSKGAAFQLPLVFFFFFEAIAFS